MGDDDKLDAFFGGLTQFIKPGRTAIDSIVFQLHYNWTFIILLLCSILVTGRQFLGDPIDCISRDDIPTELLDTFCWIHSTFSLPSAWEKKVGDEVPYPGVDTFTPGEKRVYHAYYQWVCFVLFLQAILFYLPRYIWKTVEGKRIHNLILGLNTPVLAESDKKSNLSMIKAYLTENKGKHYFYFLSYTLVHIANFINVVGQIFLMDRFLGGEFSTYGAKVAEFTGWDWGLRYDPMIKVFPRLVKCTFFRYGSSGDIQRHDAMCILPLNIINEKIYVFMWFWFVILAILTFLDLVYRVICLTVKPARHFIIKLHSSLVDPNDLRVVISEARPGDWLMLSLLSKNIDPSHYKDLIHEYANVYRSDINSRPGYFDPPTLIKNGNEKKKLPF